MHDRENEAIADEEWLAHNEAERKMVEELEMKLQKRLKVVDEYANSLHFLRRFCSGSTRKRTQADDQRVFPPLNKMRHREIF